MGALRWLLIALPVSWLLAALHASPLLVFAVTGLGVVPLAAATVIALDGESHWFEGAQLLAACAILAVAAWFI